MALATVALMPVEITALLRDQPPPSHPSWTGDSVEALVCQLTQERFEPPADFRDQRGLVVPDGLLLRCRLCGYVMPWDSPGAGHSIDCGFWGLRRIAQHYEQLQRQVFELDRELHPDRYVDGEPPEEEQP